MRRAPSSTTPFTYPTRPFGTPSNEVHKHKRAMLNPFFSRRMVLELEGVVQHKAAKIVDLMSSAIAADRPVDLHHAFRALSVDVISDYAFNKSYDLLDSPNLGAHFFAMARGVGPAMYVFQQFPSLQRLAMKIPPWLAPMLSRPLGYVVGMQMEGVKQIEDVRTRMESGKLGTARPTIFSELLDPEKQDGWPVPSTMELKDEVYSLLVAAADTTGNAMTRAAFHVINDQQAYSKLRSELLAAFPDPQAKQDFVTLERLPYLTAVIKEALRLSLGVIGRLPRVVPEGSAKFNGYFVPAGTIVGMSSWLMHLNSDVFPNPTKFNPERWLDPVEYRRLDRHMVPFGGGSRQCVGMPLAYCELYVTIGTFFHRFDDLAVWETTEDDLDHDDFFSSYHVKGKRWFKAIARG